MIPEHQLTSIAGAPVVGTGGQKIGKIVDVYESTDAATGTFVTVSTGLFGGHASFVPLDEARLDGHDVVVPYDKEQVKDAPRVAADEELTSEEEDRLYAHYSLTGGASSTTHNPVAAAGVRGTVGHDTSGPSTDNAMTRSEERLQVGTQRVEAGRARLRKRIVTETVTQTVPVTHDEVRVVREPVTGRGTGADLSEETQEVVLRAESVVVSKETVPVERVRLDTETVHEQVRVDETLRKEQIEVDGDVDGKRR